MIHTNIIKLKPDFLDEQAREEIKPKFLNKHGKKKSIKVSYVLIPAFNGMQMFHLAHNKKIKKNFQHEATWHTMPPIGF